MRKSFVEVVVTNKHEDVLVQTEIETDINHGAAMKAPTTVNPHGAVGQWSPADTSVRIRITPGNPRWTPIVTRHPEPFVPGILNPAAIVEWDVAPLIVRRPKQTIFVGLNPLARIVIRTPVRIRRDRLWTPTRANPRYLYPSAERLQLLVEILEGDLTGGVGLHWFCCHWG